MFCCFDKKVKYGDFSFIKYDTFLKNSLDHDFKNVFYLIKEHDINFEVSFRESKRNSLDSDRPNVWDTPPGLEWKQITEKMFAGHTEKSFNGNIFYLNYIKINGWNQFVKNFKTLNR